MLKEGLWVEIKYLNNIVTPFFELNPIGPFSWLSNDVLLTIFVAKATCKQLLLVTFLWYDNRNWKYDMPGWDWWRRKDTQTKCWNSYEIWYTKTKFLNFFFPFFSFSLTLYPPSGGVITFPLWKLVFHQLILYNS